MSFIENKILGGLERKLITVPFGKSLAALYIVYFSLTVIILFIKLFAVLLTHISRSFRSQ